MGVIGNYYDIKNNIDFTAWLEYFAFGIIDELERVEKDLYKQTNIETNLEDHHKTIIEFIRQYGKIKDSDYIKLTNRSKASRANDFQLLTNLGMIERKGNARSTYYVLKEK